MKALASVLFLALFASWTPSEAFAADQLLVLGRILEEGKKSEGATVTIYNGNEVYRTVTTPKNGKYAVKLPLGFYFTLEVSKEGFVTKRIVFDTRTHAPVAEIDDYICDVDLVSNEWFGTIDIGSLDFPMALISYAGDGMFDFSGEYEEHMRQTYEALLTRAMNSTSAQLSRR
jgi:hypothetical protein